MLLTTQEAAAQLRMCKKAFLRLRLPKVVVGARKFRYRQEDIDAFIRGRVSYEPTETTGKKNGRRLPARPKEVGIPKVLSWDQIQSIPLENRGRGEGGAERT